MNDVLELMKSEAIELNHFFEKARREGRGTPQEISDRREVALQKFLSRFFPFPYRIAKGNVVDSFGVRSRSIDCLILNPSHPFTVNTQDDTRFSLILADGVDVAIEVKPDLSRRDEVERALAQIASVKRLTRVKTGDAGLDKTDTNRKNIQSRIPTIIFCTESFADPQKLAEVIVEYYERERTPRKERFDFIVALNRGFFRYHSQDSYSQPTAHGEGLTYREFGELTLAQFLLLLNQLPPVEMRIGSAVLSHYIPSCPGVMTFFSHLNARLTTLDRALSA